MFVTAVWSLVDLTNKKFGIKLRLGFSFPQSDTLDGTLEGERKGKKSEEVVRFKMAVCGSQEGTIQASRR
jgi:hypothetical protein